MVISFTSCDFNFIYNKILHLILYSFTKNNRTYCTFNS
uniref:Uncharacterized protein n=1 Tax=Laurenciella marilzae TaxID=1413812 RepID=A0A1Z1M1L2_9FLOR|nr:hypothetical protein [Laurenciella marilzae]ARW59772.1 hypothetical protein [Laurenciella marilzae]